MTWKQPTTMNKSLGPSTDLWVQMATDAPSIQSSNCIVDVILNFQLIYHYYAPVNFYLFKFWVTIYLTTDLATRNLSNIWQIKRGHVGQKKTTDAIKKILSDLHNKVQYQTKDANKDLKPVIHKIVQYSDDVRSDSYTSLFKFIRHKETYSSSK